MNYTTEDLNQEIKEYLYYNTGILSLYLFLGITGNVSVLFIYTCRMKKTEERYFIPILAITDILACLAGVILGIVSNFYRANYVLDTFCKVGYFFTWATTSASGFMIMLIALNRHLRICRPTSAQLTPVRKTRAVVVMITISIVMSLPMMYFLGSRDVPYTYKGDSINATLCTLRFTDGTLNILQNAYFFFQIVLALMNMIVTCGLYIPVGVTIYRRFKIFNQNMKNRGGSSFFSSGSTNHSSVNPAHKVHGKVCCNVPQHEISVISYASTGAGENEMCPKCATSTQPSAAERKAASLNRRKVYRRKKATHNFTLMFATIIIVYILAYVPTLILFMLPGSNPANFWFSKSGVELNVLVFFQRAFVINNIVNPFIYSYFDLAFRNQLFHFLSCGRIEA